MTHLIFRWVIFFIHPSPTPPRCYSTQMYTELIFDILLSAAVIALSPFPVIAITLVLGSTHARSNGIAFVVGWLSGLSALTLAAYFVLINIEIVAGNRYDSVGWAQIIFGIILLLLALKKWQGLSKPKGEASVPAWMSSVDKLSTGKTIVLGATLAGINPKNLVFSMLFLTNLIDANVGFASTTIFIVIFIIMCSLMVLGSVGYYLVKTDSSEKALQKIKTFMITNNDTVMMYMSLIFGVVLMYKGLN